ncbi:flagellar basal body-associated FliL family protein [Kordiimonas marina]|uniref:flagellar basal body-associated FliL family protein n=1 Tax=Kordiimonas marina TaxID=2872312 RepID=UPI001FF5867F|nr:flagellar basal body-associated FliL family protein [Kordiimonas marina]MCJ9430342.1 flagellar basal body-associated FliL family protein [Kordiimonas marina]
MAEDIDDTLGEAELVEGLERKRFAGKKMLILVGAALILIAAAVGVASMFGGGDGEHEQTADNAMDKMAEQAATKRDEAKLEKDKPVEELKTLFVDVPDQLYNLNTGGEGKSFLRVKVKLEVDRESYKEELKVKMPRILDEFNVYMRELRPEDLDGAAGIIRLKEELLMRINQAVAPTRVKDVLFQEFLVQGQG